MPGELKSSCLRPFSNWNDTAQMASQALCLSCCVLLLLGATKSFSERKQDESKTAGAALFDRGREKVTVSAHQSEQHIESGERPVCREEGIQSREQTRLAHDVQQLLLGQVGEDAPQAVEPGARARKRTPWSCAGRGRRRWA